MNDIKDDFVGFDFELFTKTLAKRSDISGDIARKYLSEKEEYTDKFPSEKFEQSVGIMFEALYNEKSHLSKINF